MVALSRHTSTLFFLLMGASALASNDPQGVLTPDTNEAHCEAFGGKWLQTCLERKGLGISCAKWSDFSCVDRMEYQQRSVPGEKNFEALENFCQARRGKWERRARGWACSHPLSTSGLQRYPLPENERAEKQTYLAVLDNCLDNSYQRSANCIVSSSETTSSWYDYTNATTNGEAIVGLLIQNPLNALLDIGPSHERKLIQNSLNGAMVGLNSCQKACMAKCAAATILSYAFSAKGNPMVRYKLFSTNSLYRNRKGICTEFSRVLNDVASQSPLRTDAAYGWRHAYSMFEINGSMYIGEPQNSTCHFYHTKGTLGAYKREFARMGKEYKGEWADIITLPKRAEFYNRKPVTPKAPAQREEAANGS